MTSSPHGAPRVRPGARRPAFLAALLGLLGLATGGFVAYAAQPPPDVRAAPVSAAPAPTEAAGPPVPVTAGALPTAPTAVPPTRLRIPSIGVDAVVDPVAVDPTGQFDVPPSVDRVGWYRFGPGLEADSGSVVIAGHVDGAGQGPGAFFRLRTLAIGATVEVASADGRLRIFRAVARETYPKSSIPLQRYFVRDGAPRLTLITCGGPFDQRTRSYRDNVVITAIE